MHPLKVPGSNGFLIIFHKKSWPVIYEIQNFSIIGMMKPNWNHTFITLISKVNNPQGVSDFRPISLAM